MGLRTELRTALQSVDVFSRCTKHSFDRWNPHSVSQKWTQFHARNHGSSTVSALHCLTTVGQSSTRNSDPTSSFRAPRGKNIPCIPPIHRSSWWIVSSTVINPVYSHPHHRPRKWPRKWLIMEYPRSSRNISRLSLQ